MEACSLIPDSDCHTCQELDDDNLHVVLKFCFLLSILHVKVQLVDQLNVSFL